MCLNGLHILQPQLHHLLQVLTFNIMEKSAKKTHQELLINKLEAMKLKKSMEIDEINQLINKLKTK